MRKHSDTQRSFCQADTHRGEDDDDEEGDAEPEVPGLPEVPGSPALYDEAALRAAAAVETVLVRRAGERLAHRVILIAALSRIVAFVRQPGHAPETIVRRPRPNLGYCCVYERKYMQFFSCSCTVTICSWFY